jgi:tRNA (guanine-N7-)-methyltransferase
MARSKLRKFEEIRELPSVIEQNKPQYKNISGNWHKEFGNTNPIELELACGYGEYTNTLAQQNPNTNYIGIDIKGERIWQGAKTSEQLRLSNTRFLQCDIRLLETFFAPQEVSAIRIVHPDPFPKDKDAMKRLTHERFLAIYKSILRPHGILEIHTDDVDLFTFSCLRLQNFGAVLHRRAQNFTPHSGEKYSRYVATRFSKRALNLGKKLTYIEASFA